ncbi:mast cell protease 1A-like [Pelodiscus sinensis]|uniref:mast cell protease 1A-like n=1 Tax=Pelodiscus sinensis TaxID=13735 RepID=UPI003F6C6412
MSPRCAQLLPPGDIIGGHEDWPQSRPYMAFLQVHRGDKTIRCGGFLVVENFVLMAAHCKGDEITVILGAHNVRRKESSQQRIRVRRQIPHPEYDMKTLNNDIMLLQLEKPAKLNGFVKTIPLPQNSEWLEPRTVCSVAGWGRTIAEDGSSGSQVLREVDVKVLEDKNCTYHNYDPVTMGDSGSPLVCDGKAQGIVSWVSMDGITPGAYMRVSTFINWIQKEMGRPQP